MRKRVYPHHRMLDRRIDVRFRRFPKLTYNEERVALLKKALLKHNIILYMLRDAKRIVRIFVRVYIIYIFILYMCIRLTVSCNYFIFSFFVFFVFFRGGRNTNSIRPSCSTVIYQEIFDVETRTRALKTLALEAATPPRRLLFISSRAWNLQETSGKKKYIYQR